jgi:hypothetical protein
MKHLGSIGAFLALAGIISIVLHFVGYNLRILMWIDSWGAGVGWGIRIGLIILGAVLFLVARSSGGGGEADDED